MRVLVCGSRKFDDWAMIRKELEALLRQHRDELYIIQGEADGADKIAKEWAKSSGVKCSDQFKADWNPEGIASSKPNRFAGYLRNLDMMIRGKPQLVLAFLKAGEENKGTRSMIRIAKDKGIEVKIFWQEFKVKGMEA